MASSSEALRTDEARLARLIEAHQHAVADAEASRDRLITITNAMPALIGYLDTDARYVFTNDAYADWFGQSGKTTAGKHISEVLGKAAYDRVSDYVKRALSGERVDFEALVPYDVGEKWVRANYIPDLDRDGAVRGFFVLVVDMAEEKRVENALAASEERFRVVANHAPVMIWTTDPDGSCSFISDSWHEFTGQTIETSSGSGWSLAIHEDDREMVLSTFAVASARREPLRLEYRLRRRDGAYSWVLDSAAPWIEGALFRGYIGSVMDISERKAAEEERARLASEAEARRVLIEAIAANTASALLVVDGDGMPVYVNRAWEAMSGVAFEEMRGRPAHEVIHHTRPDGTPYPIGDCTVVRARAAGSAIRDVEEVFVRPDGTFYPVICSSMPLARDGEVIGAVLEVRDITDVKRQKEDLLRALAVKDEFLSLVSHELRTPITTVLGNADVLIRKDGSIDGEARAMALQDIKENAERLSRIIGDLLTLARAERGVLEAEPLAIGPGVRVIVDEYVHETQVPVSVAGDDAPIIANGETGVLSQVLRNFLSNAAKYGRGSEIEVRIASMKGEAQVRVLDRGMGINPAEAERLFDVFYRSPEAGPVGGMGIGLSVCKRLAEAVGGRVWAAPREGGGSEFGLALPLLGDSDEG